jgi:tripartite-type tricarboxylate transporter receptor subunit TctC
MNQASSGARLFTGLLLACAVLLGAAPAGAQPQAYPSKPIRFIVPYAAGGGTDVLTRVIAQKLGAAWNVPVVVENRTGASGQIGTEAVARAAPDGYTMLMALNSHAINLSLFGKLPYHPIKDFTPVMLVATAPNVLTVQPSSPARSVKELIALAQSQPGKLSYASGGPGSSSNLAGELFKSMAKVDILEVAYKGAGPAMNDLLGGQVSMSFVVLQTALPHIASGRLRALAVTSATRSAFAPDVPTVAESGLPAYEVVTWYGTLGPAGIPPEIVSKWSAELSRTLAMADVKEKLIVLGMEGQGGTPQQFDQFIRADWAVWDKLIKTQGIRAQ